MIQPWPTSRETLEQESPIRIFWLGWNGWSVDPDLSLSLVWATQQCVWAQARQGSAGEADQEVAGRERWSANHTSYNWSLNHSLKGDLGMHLWSTHVLMRYGKQPLFSFCGWERWRPRGSCGDDSSPAQKTAMAYVVIDAVRRQNPSAVASIAKRTNQ